MSDHEQSAIGSAIAQAAGAGATATVNFGYTAVEVERLLTITSTEQQATIADLSKKLDASEQAVRGFLRLLKEDDVPIDQLLPKLTLISQQHRDIRRRLEGLRPEDPAVQDYFKRALLLLNKASSATDYEEIDLLLRRAEETQECTLQESENLHRDLDASMSRLRCELAATRSERGQLCLQRFEYLQAASHFEAAIAALPQNEQARSFGYRIGVADSWAAYGDEKGHSGFLVQAVDVYKDLLRRFNLEDKSETKADLLCRLGTGLAKLSKQENGTQRLHEAVAVYRQALASLTDGQACSMRAQIRTGLALVLQDLSYAEANTSLLREAVDLHREVLAVRSIDDAPLDWAVAQSNLGFALRMLSAYESDRASLANAIEHFRRALEVCTRSEVPLLWATMHFNLAIALESSGSQEGGDIESLRAAVASYRCALVERRRDRVPLLWALTNWRLGNALRVLGEKEASVSSLKEAVAFHRHALAEYDRDKHPHNWAKCQSSLGVALSSLGGLGDDREAARDAIVAHHLALELRSSYQQEKMWAGFQNSLGVSLVRLALQEQKFDKGFEALEAFECAIRVWLKERDSTQTALVQANILWTLEVFRYIRFKTKDCRRYRNLRIALHFGRWFARFFPTGPEKVLRLAYGLATLLKRDWVFRRSDEVTRPRA